MVAASWGLVAEGINVSEPAGTDFSPFALSFKLL